MPNVEPHAAASLSAAPGGGDAQALAVDAAERDERLRGLLAGIARGDRVAFEEFYRAWFERVLAMANAASGWDESRAMDVVQDAMVRLIDRPPRIECEGQLAVWMHRVVLSCAVDRMRRQSRRAARERRRGYSGAAAGIGADPAGIASDVERLAWLESQLAALPGSDRELLRMRFADGSTLESAGERSGTSGDAVHGRVRRVIQGLRARAKEMFP